MPYPLTPSQQRLMADTPVKKLPAKAKAPETYTVVGAKRDVWGDLNYKYIEEFTDLESAIAALDTVMDYPIHFIEYDGRVIEVWPAGTHPSYS